MTASEALDRRGFFSWALNGLSATAFLHLLGRDGLVRADDGKPHPDGGRPGLQRSPKARRVVQICLVGGMSHLETEVERDRTVRSRRRTTLAAAAFVFLCVAVVTIFYVDATRLPPAVRDLLALLLGKT